MTAPSIIQGAGTQYQASGTFQNTDQPITITYPAGIAAGDLLVLNFQSYGMGGNAAAPYSNIYTVPAGWTLVVNESVYVGHTGGPLSPTTSRYLYFRQWTRRATGSESGSTFSVTLGGAYYPSGGAFDDRRNSTHVTVIKGGAVIAGWASASTPTPGGDPTLTTPPLDPGGQAAYHVVFWANPAGSILSTTPANSPPWLQTSDLTTRRFWNVAGVPVSGPVWNTAGAGCVSTVAVAARPDHCAAFVGRISDVSNSVNVQLSIASSAFPDALSNYRISFFDNTTGNTTPSTALLSGGPWTIGPMTAGQHIRYAITRTDGAHIDGSAVMRATDTAFGLFWDVEVKCLGGGGAYQFRRGRRAHIAGATGVSIQGR